MERHFSSRCKKPGRAVAVLDRFKNSALVGSGRVEDIPFRLDNFYELLPRRRKTESDQSDPSLLVDKWEERSTKFRPHHQHHRKWTVGSPEPRRRGAMVIFFPSSDRFRLMDVQKGVVSHRHRMESQNKRQQKSDIPEPFCLEHHGSRHWPRQKTVHTFSIVHDRQHEGPWRFSDGSRQI